MPRTLDIGRRIELVPMDTHFHDVSLGFYRQEGDKGPRYLIHSYSGMEGIDDRVAFVREAAKTLGGLESDGDGRLHFPCRSEHGAGARRVFLEVCKIATGETVQARSLEIDDKKAGCRIFVSSLGEGAYEVSAQNDDEKVHRRVDLIARGLGRLGEMELDPESLGRVAFSCGHAHDSLVGLLLIRAPNVRAVLREQEAALTRGVLAAPSQQK